MDSRMTYIDESEFGISSGIRERAERLSDALYNKGLKLAQLSALSDASEALERSLEFNKRNIQARNLLGLCYYAAGRLGEALYHWVISTGYQKEGNLAHEYVDDVRNNQRATDKVNHSVALYNAALDFFKAGNGDMSILRLKKSVELNPAFLDACNLLTLGYLTQKKQPAAEQYVRKALQIDPFNQTALLYYAEITGANRPATRTRGSGKPQLMDVKGYAKPSNARNIVNDLHLSEIICFLIGCAIMTAVFFFLVMPDRDKSLKEQVVTLEEEVKTAQEAGQLALTEKEAEYQDYDDRMASYENTIADLESQISLRDRVEALEQGKAYLAANNYSMSFTMAVETSTDGFSPEQIQEHTDLLNKSSLGMEAESYNIAKGHYDAGRYDDAQWHFSQAMKFTTPESPTAGLMYYYLGRIAERNEDIQTAINYYDKVVTEYPSSGQFKDASARLDRLRE